MDELVDFRNNVIYNWGEVNGGYAGEGGRYNMVNNYYKAGPATGEKIRCRIFHANADDGTNKQPKGIFGTFYVNGNYMEGKGQHWDWEGMQVDNRHNKQMTLETIRSAEEYPYGQVTTHRAEKAYEKVLMYAGVCHSRDIVDRRVVEETAHGTYTFTGSVLNGKGIIDSQQDVGGWPELKQGINPPDTDHDGIPDAWAAVNLPPGKLYNDIDPATGYCYLELYINSLVADLVKAGNEEAGPVN
ncbi:MAG: hypothetical protein LUD74_04455 [Tannerellaceae bacterium]|nr:hypothetical protein [Tannerellaceae bacterium]